MSIEKKMNTRIQHKHDTEANWNKALNFIPKIGEIIVYDIDENHNYSRFKIGDGVRTINNIEFSQTDLTGYATESYVNSAVANLVNTAPEALNTLNELASALGDDPNFATTVTTEIGKKVDKVNGKGLSTNDFTNEYKNKLDQYNPDSVITEETDPTVPAWAKTASKPSYTKSEIGLSNVDNIKQYSANNPPVAVQTVAPSDTNLLWIDPNDKTFAYVPVKGVDYWTPADQEDIIQQVITALGTPVFGRVDEENNIILTGGLADGVYKLWYEDATGKMTELCTYDTSPGYINWLKRSVEADGITPYNSGQGWKTNTRLNSNGVETTSSATNIEVTGFIPIKYGDIIRLKNITIPNMGPDDYTYAAQTYFTIYDVDKQPLMSKNISYLYLGSTNTQGYGLTLDAPKGNIIEMRTDELYNPGYPDVDWRNENMAFFRISCEEINDNSIITINQEIPKDETPDVVNWIPKSTEVDGVTIYNNGKGYKEDTRWSKSGGGDISEPGVTVSGYIPVKVGDVIRIKNITMNKNYQASNANVCNVCYFWSLAATDGASGDATVIANDFSGIFDANGNLTQFTIPESLHPTYIRLNTSYIGPDSILTINEEIPDGDEPTDTNLFVSTTATLNTRMSGTNQQPKAADGYVMSAMIHLPLELTLTDSYDESTPYIAVPSTMWANSANLLGYRYDGVQNGYMSADGGSGTIVGDWVKIPLYNQWGGTVTITDFVISLYVSASAITEANIQDIKIYFNKIPEQSEDNTQTSIDILNTYELQLNKRWSASGKSWSDCNGMLTIVVPFADIKDKVVRFTGFQQINAADNNTPRWYAINESNATQYGMFTSKYTSAGTTDDVFSAYVVNEGGGTYSIAINQDNIGVYNNTSVVRVMMCMVLNSSGTAITEADLANFSMVINDPSV